MNPMDFIMQRLINGWSMLENSNSSSWGVEEWKCSIFSSFSSFIIAGSKRGLV